MKIGSCAQDIVMPAKAGIQLSPDRARRWVYWIPAFAGMTALFSAASAQAYDLRGEWKQGSVLVGKAEPGTRVWFKGAELLVSPQGEFVFGLDRDEPEEAWLKIQAPGGAPQSERHPVAKREYEIQRIEGLPPEQVVPPKWALKRIEQDLKQIVAARSVKSPLTGFAQNFVWPANGRVSGVFGSQRILNGVPKQPHNGVDVAVPTGTEVRAPADGIVVLAVPDMYYTGGSLMIDHGHGLSSIMVHLSKLLAQKGQTVKQGEVVALSGMTGRATGPHLHWGMNWLGAKVDPQTLVPAMAVAEPVPEKNP